MFHISQNKSTDYVSEFKDLGIKDRMTSVLRQTAVFISIRNRWQEQCSGWRNETHRLSWETLNERDDLGRPGPRWKNTLKMELQRSRCRVLVEKLTVPQLAPKKFPLFYVTLRFIAVLTTARHQSLSPNPDQSIPCAPSYFSTNYFDIILPFTPTSSK